MGLVKPTEQMKKVSRNLGIGDVGGGSQERPLASSLVRAVATDLGEITVLVRTQTQNRGNRYIDYREQEH